MQVGRHVHSAHEVGMASFVCRLWTGVENPSTFTTMQHLQQCVGSVCEDSLIDEVLRGQFINY